MSRSSLIRRASCFLLAIALIAPIGVRPARAVMAISADAATVALMHDSAVKSHCEHAQHPPCKKGCCPRATCDLSACISTGVLPQVASLPGAMPPVPFAFPCPSTAPPASLIDTPLRPPIA
ncbi:MAG: hypothetical protein ACHP7D_08715 [Lysobacterales bacterium]